MEHIEPLAVGAIAVAIGVTLIVKRVPISRYMAKNQRRMYGKGGESVASASSPKITAAVGIAGIVIGVLILTIALVKFPWQ